MRDSLRGFQSGSCGILASGEHGDVDKHKIAINIMRRGVTSK